MHDLHALMVLPPTHVMRSRSFAPTSHAIVGVTGLLAIAVFLAGLPLASMGAVIAGAVASLALASWRASDDSIADAMPPEAIVSVEAQESYRAILIAFAELERVIADAPGVAPVVAPALERCAAAVRLSARMGRSANPLQRYLDAHDPASIQAELGRLRARAEITADARAVAALSHAAAARARQLATREAIATARDRIQARLELVRAALESFAAMIVSIDMADADGVEDAGDAIATCLDDAHEELAAIDSALGELAA